MSEEAPKINDAPDDGVAGGPAQVRVSVESLERPLGIIEQTPERGGFVRRWVREDEMDHMENEGWGRARAGKNERFKDKISDPVADHMLLVEIPKEDYDRYAYRHMGGRRNELIRENLKRGAGDERTGGERISTEEHRLPPQANVRRR